MRLENSFEVAASPEAAWALLLDVPRVIPCMPGATLDEVVDDSTWKATMQVKLGPIGLTFATDVTREEADAAAKRVRLRATAREVRNRGGAQATVESTLTSANGGTRVDIVTELTLSGNRRPVRARARPRHLLAASHELRRVPASPARGHAR
jgi:carbon monoxide dehydrogenase subunit G